MKYNKIPLDVSIHMRYLYQDKKESINQICKRYPHYAKRSIYRHVKKTIGEKTEDRRHNNPGHPRKLSQRDERKLVQQIKKLRSTTGVFHSKHIQQAAGLSEKIYSNRCVRRSLNRNGYQYRQCRRKGQVTQADMKLRLNFARNVKKNYPEDFWTNDVCFYLDGVSWAHKTNPYKNAKTGRTRTWRQQNEGLKVFCTAKGKKEGVGGKVARFFVAIAHGAGVVHVEHFPEHVNGENFSKFIRQKFKTIFSKCGTKRKRLFLQDGDPSQNSAAAVKAMTKL